MSLDSYLFKKRKEKLEWIDDNIEEVAYLRKEHDVNNFFATYYEGEETDHNCQYIEVTMDMLYELQDEIKEEYFECGDKKEVRKFIIEGLDALENNYDLAYFAWW